LLVPTSLLVALILALFMSACGGEDAKATERLGRQLIEAARVGDAAEVRATGSSSHPDGRVEMRLARAFGVADHTVAAGLG